MATYTRIPESETPSIRVDVNRRLSRIDPNIYGGFMEHMGRCIYGGIYDPGNPLSDSHGFRTDVLSALRELEIPVIRYPGGNFVATYHWKDGVGPKENRPARPELAWLGTETNEFGTDEFMKWLSVLSEGREKRVEPYFALNFGTGTLDEALAWWAKALKLLDPNLILILCGETGLASWDHEVLKDCIPFVDMHSIHMYTASKDHVANVIAPLCAERAIETAAALIDIARIEKNVSPSMPRTRICFDEWNVWDPVRAPGEEGGEETYTLSDALAVAIWLNVFVRQSKWVGMANVAQSVNVISPLMTTKEGILKQTTWWPLFLFSKYMRGWTVSVHVQAGAYDGSTEPKWLQSVLDQGASWLDVSASVNEEGMLSLVVVNVSETQDLETEITGVEKEVEVFTVTGRGVTVVNTGDQEEVGVEESTWDGRGKYNFPKHSMTLLRWNTGKKVTEVKKGVVGLANKKLASTVAW
ncbi:putative alpha-N-arabinofuranosidase C [Diplocarpon rosae]|nr:putative alpha-N-arabinofuranosidase C [Diplocarpon rosae]